MASVPEHFGNEAHGPTSEWTNIDNEIDISPLLDYSPSMKATKAVEELNTIEDALFHLARLTLSGRDQDSTLYIQRLARRLRHDHPELAASLVGILREAPTRQSPLRRAAQAPLPVADDSRLALARVEDPPVVDDAPILPDSTRRKVRQLLDERRRAGMLVDAGLAPTRTALLIGPPGVGKTMAARWLAASLGVPLLILDLSAVMSSLLGRTGTNLRHVLDYAKDQDCVLLIDELDSIGKRRDDDADIGELKRLVNVLLQQLDDWPTLAALLLGATNHPQLLDPAIWRRFETTIEFPLPDHGARVEAIGRFSAGSLAGGLATALAHAFDGMSFGEIESALHRARRAAALGYGSVEECVLDICAEHVRLLRPSERRSLAVSLVGDFGLSQHHAHRLTGVSRDTIRKYLADDDARPARG